VTESGDHYPEKEEFIRAAAQLTGDVIQTPSMYSAIKVGGKPLYLRARRGESVDVPQRTVHIDEIALIREVPDHGFEIRVRCGRGTYIRTLCADLGKLCGCPAHMRSLTRTQSGFFRIEEAITTEEAEQMAAKGILNEYLLPPDYPLGHLPRTDIPVKMKKLVVNGSKMPLVSGTEGLTNGEPVRVYLEGQFWGIAKRRDHELIWKVQIAPEDGPEEMK
jgi:tRNA pseudouridine55 synthase